MSRPAIARVNVNRWKPWLSRGGSLQTVIFRTRRNSLGELHFKPELSNRRQYPG